MKYNAHDATHVFECRAKCLHVDLSAVAVVQASRSTARGREIEDSVDIKCMARTAAMEENELTIAHARICSPLSLQLAGVGGEQLLLLLVLRGATGLLSLLHGVGVDVDAELLLLRMLLLLRVLLLIQHGVGWRSADVGLGGGGGNAQGVHVRGLGRRAGNHASADETASAAVAS